MNEVPPSICSGETRTIGRRLVDVQDVPDVPDVPLAESSELCNPSTRIILRRSIHFAACSTQGGPPYGTLTSFTRPKSLVEPSAHLDTLLAGKRNVLSERNEQTAFRVCMLEFFDNFTRVFRDVSLDPPELNRSQGGQTPVVRPGRTPITKRQGGERRIDGAGRRRRGIACESSRRGIGGAGKPLKKNAGSG